VRLLVTRPEEDAERTAASLRARGHSVVVAPLLHIEALPDAEIGSGPWAAILVTSANAAFAIARHPRGAELKNVPVLAVGERSAQAMRAAGFAEVISAGGDLARLAAERLKQGVPLLYLAGTDRSGDIAGDLRAQNYTVRTAVIYHAVAATALPRAAAEALAGGIDGDFDLFGDGSIQMLKTPGHTPGECSLFVRLPNRKVVLTGDTTHLRAALEGEITMPGDVDPAAAVLSLRRLKAIRDFHEASLIISHDPEDWAEFPHAPAAIE